MTSPDAANILHTLKQLESTSSSIVFRSLQDLRSKLLKSPGDTQLFIENNGHKYLFRFIRKPNEKILDLTLSVLANLCLREEFRLKVAEENGMISHILSLVSHIQKDSIIGRTCRLIGNLATSKTIALKLHHKGAVPKLTETIKSKDNSPGTKHMAVRALRLLWEAEVNKAQMLQDQVVHSVASLIGTPVDELLQAVLKALAVFTHHCNEQCALQVQGDGNGFDELVASISSCSKQDLPVNVILNLCFVPEVRPLLGTAGIVEVVMNLINNKTPKDYSSNIVSILCLLCRESVNRSKIRRNGGLEVLLETLRRDNRPSLEARALNAMLHFIYDEVGLEILIREGLVPVLVNKLVKVVHSHGNVHVSEVRDNAESGSMVSNSNCHKRIRLSGSKEENASYTCHKFCDPLGLRTSSRSDSALGGQWSPGSSRSVEFSPDTTRTYSSPPPYASSSPTSSALSPASQSSPPSPLSDAYSPVCGYSSSEDEKQDDIDDEAAVECDAESDCEVTSPCLKDKDDIDDIQEALKANLPSNVTSRHSLVESWCLLLLSRVSHMDVLVDDMVSSHTIDTLLQYYTLLEPPHPRAARILQRITRNHHCLVPLLRAGLVLKVNTRLAEKSHEDCTRCRDFEKLRNSLLSQLSLIAESGFGEGVIVHHLIRATRPVQAFLIVSVPYIIRKKKLLRAMLHCKISNKSGLDLLLQLITDECGDGLSQEAVDSVSYLAHQIGALGADALDILKYIKTTMCAETISNCSFNGYNVSDRESNNDLVEIELDSGATVTVIRGELCAESPMFSAMLTGSFYESGRHHVSLKEVSEKCLCTLLSLVRAPGHCQCCLASHDTNFAFEVLELADRFILPKIVDRVADWLVSQLAPDVVSSVYLHAQNLRHVLPCTKVISKKSLRFALSRKIEKRKRYEIFSAILSSDFRKQFIDDIVSLIKLHIDEPS